MNKRFAAGTAAVLTALLLAAPASAHCGQGRLHHLSGLHGGEL